MSKISNIKKEVPDTMNMNEKDYSNELLSILKSMVKNYAVSLTEASNEVLYNKYKEMFLKYSSLQRSLFEVMFKKGWYELETVEITKLDEKYNMLNNEYNTLRTI